MKDTEAKLDFLMENYKDFTKYLEDNYELRRAEYVFKRQGLDFMIETDPDDSVSSFLADADFDDWFEAEMEASYKQFNEDVMCHRKHMEDIINS